MTDHSLIPATRVGAQPTRSRDTYFCLRCGIERRRGYSGGRSGYCRDCRDVEPRIRRGLL